MFTSPRGRRKIFLQHRKSIVGPQWIFPDVEVVRRCPRSAVSLMFVCAQNRSQTLVVDRVERPTCWLARLAGPVTAIEVTHGADTMAQRCGWVLAMPSANGGVVMSRHVPPPPLQCAQRTGDREGNGDRELPSRIRLSCRSPRALVGVPPRGCGRPMSRWPGRTRPGNSTDVW